MDKEFPFHYRIKAGSKFKFETPSAEGRELEVIGNANAVREIYATGDELFHFHSKEYIDLFSTFELTIEYS